LILLILLLFEKSACAGARVLHFGASVGTKFSVFDARLSSAFGGGEMSEAR
jgi:hypothetical protein